MAELLKVCLLRKFIFSHFLTSNSPKPSTLISLSALLYKYATLTIIAALRNADHLSKNSGNHLRNHYHNLYLS